MTSLYLTDEEMILLDGQCSAKVQIAVEGAKARLAAIQSKPDVPPKLACFVADVVTLAKKQMALELRHISLSRCRICEKSGGYRRFKSGRQKGQEDWNRPLYLSGVDLQISSVIMRGVAGCGCCTDCWEEAKPLVAEAVRDLEIEVDPKITGAPSRWKRHQKVRCVKCEWLGHEGQLGLLPAMFGGYYPGQCPNCKAKNVALGPRVIEHLHGQFEVVPVKQQEAANA